MSSPPAAEAASPTRKDSSGDLTPVKSEVVVGGQIRRPDGTVVRHRIAIAQRYSRENHALRTEALLGSLTETERVARESLEQDEVLLRAALTSTAMRVKATGNRVPAAITTTRKVKGTKSVRFMSASSRPRYDARFVPRALVLNRDDAPLPDDSAPPRNPLEESITGVDVEGSPERDPVASATDARRAAARARRERRRGSATSQPESSHDPTPATEPGASTEPESQHTSGADEPQKEERKQLHPLRVRPATASQAEREAAERKRLDFTERSLMLRCFSVDRHALVFEYRALWVDALQALKEAIRTSVLPQYLEARSFFAARRIQSCWRKYVCRNPYVKLLAALVRIQSVGRGFSERSVKFKRFAAQTSLQRVVVRAANGQKARKTVGVAHHAEVTRFKREVAATKIQSTFRMSKRRDSFVQRRVEVASALTIQRHVRVWLDIVRRRILDRELDATEAAYRGRLIIADFKAAEHADRVHLLEVERWLRDGLASCLRAIVVAEEKRRVVKGFLTSAADARVVGAPRTPLVTDLKSANLDRPRMRPQSSPQRVRHDAVRAGPTVSRQRQRLSLLLVELQESISRHYDVVLPELARRAWYLDRHRAVIYEHRTIAALTEQQNLLK